ncbi:MAG TPA: hypothetical protein VGR47_18490 [Terracidiphilus sp.]|nr:hypothetical protein [Terracidiphilus sp.]
MSSTMLPTVGVRLAASKTLAVPPPLQWITGTVQEILVQPGENFFVFSVRNADKSVILRIADPHNGHPLAGVTTSNLEYDMMKEAYFRKLQVEVGYRDFGPDPQAGINNLAIDRVILMQ